MNTQARQRTESRLVWLMTAVAVLIVVLMPVHAFMSTWLGTTVGPLLFWKSWKEILLVSLVPVVLWYCALRPDIMNVLWQRWVNKLIALYVLLHLGLSFISTASSEAVIAGLMMNLRFFAIFLLVQLIVEANPPYLKRIRDVTPQWLFFAMCGLGILAILQVFVLPKDFLAQFGYNKDATIAPYVLVDQNQHAVRAFATMRGPNTLGAYLLLPLAVAFYMLYRKRRNALVWSALILGLIALFLTGSRSAWLGALVSLLTLGVLVVPWHRLRRLLEMSILPAIILAVLIGWAAETIPAVHLAVFHTNSNHSTADVGSDKKHWQATAQGIMDVVRHPFGTGPGSAGPASFYNRGGVNLSENYYVQIAQETGLAGIALFIWINVLVVLSIVRRKPDHLSMALISSFAGLVVVNIFLHGWADDPTALTWWALAGLYIGKKQ